jgi:hypothetical protein
MVSSAGDFNGDGYEDMLIVAPGASPNGVSGAGSAYVVFGQPSSYSWPATFNLSSLNGANGVRFDGVVPGVAWVYNFATAGLGLSNNAGVVGSVGAGNLLGGTTSDLFIGAARQTYGGNAMAGIGYVVYGKTTAWSSPTSLSGVCATATCQ